jgi:recombination protein RecA
MSTAAEIQQRLKKKFPELVTGSTIPPVNFIATGFVGFDYLMGGGLPQGRIIELVGATHTGKSIAALTMVAPLTRQGKIVYICDSENSIDHSYLVRAGIDPDYVVIRNTGSLNKALEFYQTVLSEPEIYNPGAFIFDTIKGFQPDASIDKLQDNAGAALMASAARVWSQHHGILIDLAMSSGAVVFGCNHIMTNLSPYAGPTSKPGGGTFPQISSLCLAIKGKGRKLDDDLKGLGEDYPGFMSVDIVVEKSRFGTLGRSITVDILPTGYDNLTTLIRLAKSEGLIKATGAWYLLHLPGGDYKCQGLAATYKYLGENPQAVSWLAQEVVNPTIQPLVLDEELTTTTLEPT